MNAVGSNDVGGSRRFAGGKLNINVFIIADDVDAAFAKMDCVRLQTPHRFNKHGVKVAAMQQDMRRAITLVAGRAEIIPIPGLAGTTVADFLAQRAERDMAERVFEPERLQNAGAVRADLDAGAHFA